MIYDVAKTNIPFAEDLNKIGNTTIAIETELGLTPSGAAATVAARLDDIDAIIAAIKPALWPVGSIYSNASDATNPATLLGFGTWVAMENRVLVGKGAGTFATAGATGGAETHTLTVAEMPSHNHTHRQWIFNGAVSSGAHYGFGYSMNTGSTFDAAAASASGEVQFGNWATGGGGAHNNLQPYTVVYMWKRTA